MGTVSSRWRWGQGAIFTHVLIERDNFVAPNDSTATTAAARDEKKFYEQPWVSFIRLRALMVNSLSLSLSPQFDGVIAGVGFIIIMVLVAIACVIACCCYFKCKQ